MMPAPTRRHPVADLLAADEHGRVRVVHRTENSGGCGQPRNDGIAEARGTYLMFLDSDDTLDRHACRNLVAAAEENGAELVSGCCWRVFPDKDEEHAWYRGVYRERGVYASVREHPELLYDTLSTNKLYRRDFLDREGLRFADRACTTRTCCSATQAYLAARKIAIIPHRVYNWMIYRERRDAVDHQPAGRAAQLLRPAGDLPAHRRGVRAVRAPMTSSCPRT